LRLPIYLDPLHETNWVRTLGLAQMGAASLLFLVYLALGSGYASAGTAMVAAIAMSNLGLANGSFHFC